MSRNIDLKNITRFDQVARPPRKMGQHGWWVRVQKQGKKFHHFFNDLKYGGIDKALIAAKHFRDAVNVEYIDRFGVKYPNPRDKATTRSASGVVGVTRSSYEYTKRGKKYRAEVWQGGWPLGNGKHTCKSFSIKKHGEEGAFRLAFRAREEGLQSYSKAPEESYEYYPPEDLNQKIWRYLDFTKFISMLDCKSLFFPSASSFLDRFEGSYSKLNIEMRPLLNKNKTKPSIRKIIDLEKLKNEVGISCWHANDFESAAMWTLYSKSSESVCVQSTYQRLVLALEEQSEVGMVQYVDYLNYFIPEYDPYLAFFHKRKSFEHENEIRAIIKNLSESEIGVGRNVSVELDLLIENIYVSPQSPSWFYELVKSSLGKYGIQKNVIKSSLADDPIY